MKYERRGAEIRDLETGERWAFPSINLAKKESRRLQLQEGGLGRGSLRLA